MREILLVRHGKAVEHSSGGDAARTLTDDGKDIIRGVGRALVALDLIPGAIWHSPFVRASETATLLREVTGNVAPLKADGALAPGSSSERAAALLLESREKRLLVVSHMPLLPALMTELVGARVEFGTGTVARVLALGPHGSVLAGLWDAELLGLVKGTP
jgi:phosphohistidine phosphatase